MKYFRYRQESTGTGKEGQYEDQRYHVVSVLTSGLDDIRLEMKEPGVDGVGEVMKNYLVQNMKIHITKAYRHTLQSQRSKWN